MTLLEHIETCRIVVTVLGRTIFFFVIMKGVFSFMLAIFKVLECKMKMTGAEVN
jgi:hypothetical protein